MDSHLLDWIASVDRSTTICLNGIELLPHALVQILNGLAVNAMPRGLPIFLPFAWIWRSADANRRNRMLAGVLATCVAVFLSIELQHHLQIHVRPFLDRSLAITVLKPDLKGGWDHPWSFPSDTATLYFALAAIVFRENKLLGALSFAWAVLVVGVLRVVIGFHYPTDIVAGVVLGVGTVLLARQVGFDHLLGRVTRRLSPAVADAAVLVFLLDAYSLFPGAQGILHVASDFIHTV